MTSALARRVSTAFGPKRMLNNAYTCRRRSKVERENLLRGTRSAYIGKADMEEKDVRTSGLEEETLENLELRRVSALLILPNSALNQVYSKCTRKELLDVML